MIDKKIYTTCPVDNVAVWTGFRAPLGTDLTGLKKVTMRCCPSCLREHLWNGAEAYWDEDEMEPSRTRGFGARWRRQR